MPIPVSPTNSSTRPWARTRLRQDAQVWSTSPAILNPTWRVPPPCIASRALMHRLSSTWPICTGSSSTAGRSASRSVLSSMVAGSVERSSLSDSLTSGARDSGRGSPRRLRLKVSICWMRSRARVEARCACSRYLPKPRIPLAGGPIPGQRDVAHDAGQDIVEVVGDAAGQVADRLHFLRLPQLRLEAFALGLGLSAPRQIAHDRQDVRAALVVHARTAQLDLDRPAVALERGAVALEGAAVRDPCGQLAGQVPAAHGQQLVGSAPQHLLASIPEQGDEGGIDVDDPALLVEHRHAVHRRVEDGAILLLARAQGPLGALARRDVGGDRAHRIRLAVLVHQRKPAGEKRHALAAHLQLLLELHGSAGFEGARGVGVRHRRRLRAAAGRC